VYLVELRVAYAGGELFDKNMRRTGVTDVQVIDNQWFSDCYVDSGFDLHGDLRATDLSPYGRRLKMLCDRLLVCGRILVGHAPFSDSASQPALLGTSGEAISYTAAYRAIPGALEDSSR
jgi:hypothetical protein